MNDDKENEVNQKPTEQVEIAKETKPRKNRFGVSLITYVLSLIMVALLAIFGTGYYFTGQNPLDLVKNSENNLTTKEMSAIHQTFNTLMSNYIGDVPHNTLVNAALDGMTSAVDDPYTQYLIDQESDSLDESIEGSFEGIGAQIIESDNFIQVVSPIKGSPAEKAGLKPNDIIISVDGQSIEGYTSTEAVELIRGESGSDVVLGIKRGETEQSVTVTRDTIPIQSVYGEVLESNPTVGHIQITNFSTPTYDELVETITTLRESGARSFVLDVRGNPGGLLTSVLQISNMFLEDGDTIMQTQEKDQDPVTYQASDSDYGDFQVTEPVTVLIDGGSASASEILAAALQESADIPVVGTNSFGKGTVQTVIPVSDSSDLKVTVAKWLTPDGTWINEKGVKPDVVAELPAYANLTLIDTSKTYEIGDQSEQVLNIEKILSVLGYLEEDTVDDTYDEATQAAIEHVQSDNNITVSGVIDRETALIMVQLIQEQIINNDTQLEAAIEVIKQ